MNIGENIRRIRKEKNMTQKELGEKLGGISQQQIGQWENGNKYPKLETVRKIAAALHVTIGELNPDWFKFSKYEIENDFKNELSLSELSLLQDFRLLNNCGQDKAIEQVEMLTKIPEYRKEEAAPDQDAPAEDPEE